MKVVWIIVSAAVYVLGRTLGYGWPARNRLAGADQVSFPPVLWRICHG
jgi:hypothetical protein